MKAVVAFLPRNLKLHSASVEDTTEKINDATEKGSSDECVNTNDSEKGPCVTCHVSHIIFFYKVVKLIGGGSVINKANPV